jgi:hypothetical protein
MANYASLAGGASMDPVLADQTFRLHRRRLTEFVARVRPVTPDQPDLIGSLGDKGRWVSMLIIGGIESASSSRAPHAGQLYGLG